MTRLPEPLASGCAALQILCLRHADDDVEVVLADLPANVAGVCERVGPSGWRISISRRDATASPLLALLALVHEWGHYRAWGTSGQHHHRGHWPAEMARAHRVIATLSAA